MNLLHIPRRPLSRLAPLASLGALLLALSTPAQAQDEPPKFKPKEQAADPTAPAPAEITHEAQASLAGFFAAGNVSSLAGKAEGYYQLRAWDHGARVEAGGGLSGVAVNTDEDPATGFELPLDKNINTLLTGKVRYDYFITNEDTAYTSLFALHDSAANLFARSRAEVGYRRFLFNQNKHALAAELGAVYTIENAPFDGDTNGDGQTNLEDDLRFEDNGGSVGARVMVAYSNGLSDHLAFNQMFEVVSNLWPEIEAPYEQARIDADADNMVGIGEATTFASKTALTVNPADNLSFSFMVGVAYDNAAIARRNTYTNYDVTTSLTLSYKFF